MLQVYGLVPILSARENVSIALRARGVKPRPRPTSTPRRRWPASTSPTSATARSRSSPVGQMQRVACARGFVVGAGGPARRRADQRAGRGQPRPGPGRAARGGGARGRRRGRDPRPGRGRGLRPALRARRGPADRPRGVDLAQFGARARYRGGGPAHFDAASSPPGLPVGAGPERLEATPEPVAAARRITERRRSPAPDRRPCMNRTLRGAWPGEGAAAPAPPHRGRRGGRGHRARVRRPGGHLAAARGTPPAARGRRRPRHRPGARQRPPHRDRDGPAARPAGR